MKLELTERESKHLTSFSETEPDSDYVYSLQDLWRIVPKQIEVDNMHYNFVCSYFNRGYLCGYFTEFSMWGGETINSESYYQNYNIELIDGIYETLIWYLKRLNANN